MCTHVNINVQRCNLSKAQNVMQKLKSDIEVSCITRKCQCAVVFMIFTRTMLLHERVMPAYVVCPSVCPSGVTLMYSDHISWAIPRILLHE